MIGAMCGVAIAILVAVLWPVRYASHPWPGYEKAAGQGRTSHEYNSSPVARRDALFALAVLGLGAGALLYARPGTVLFAWLGVSCALLLSAFAWPQARASNLAPLAVIVYPIQALPFLATAYIAAASRRLFQRAANSRDSVIR